MLVIVPRVMAPRRRPAASIAVSPVSFASPPLAVVVHRLLRRRQELNQLNQPRLKAFLKATLENRRALFDRDHTHSWSGSACAVSQLRGKHGEDGGRRKLAVPDSSAHRRASKRRRTGRQGVCGVLEPWGREIVSRIPSQNKTLKCGFVGGPRPQPTYVYKPLPLASWAFH